MALRAVPDHPKFAHLKAVLRMPKGAALGYLEAVWHFTGRFTPQGNIGKYDDGAIEAWVEWQGEPGALIAALVETRWIDRDDVHRLLVHDWHLHADKATKNALTRAEADFCTPTVRTESPGVRTVSPLSGTVSRLPVPEPVPEPEANTLSAAESAADIAGKTFDATDEQRAEAWNGNGDGSANGNGHGPPKKSLLSPELETVLGNVAARIHARHPALRRCGLGEVKNHLRAIARRDTPGKRAELLRLVDQNHAAWCKTEQWTDDGGKYALGLSNWLAPTKERWAEPPPNAADPDLEPPRLMM